MKKYITEFIWVLFLVLTIWLAKWVLAPLAIWAVLVSLVYSGADNSWSHYNPAVTIWLCINNKISKSEALIYILSQIWWAILWWLLAYFILHNTWLVVVLLVEFLYTFLLVRTVYNVAVDKVNSYFGISIWFVVLAWAISVWSISWWAFNPAVVIWWLFDGTFSISQLIYIFVNIWAWVFAWLLYKNLK